MGCLCLVNLQKRKLQNGNRDRKLIVQKLIFDTFEETLNKK
jgi:hypothetical protein